MENTKKLIEEAIAGDKQSLELLLLGIKDMVFNLSLRMLGTIPDAEDASQEILIKVMTNLSSFRQESKFSTWVFRIATNHLQNYKKNMFSKHPLSFEYYGMDIKEGKTEDVPDLSGGVDRKLLSQELKLSCTNVMLQCLDAESRCIFILGTMFRLDSAVAGDIMGLSAQAYRQRLSRIRQKVAAFLSEYCGLSRTGACSCEKRVNYAIANRRIDPKNLAFVSLEQCEDRTTACFVDNMEQLDELSQIFASFPAYRSTENATSFIRKLIKSPQFYQVIKPEEAPL